MIKAFWSHFKHFGRLLGKIDLFLIKTDGRVPNQQGAPTTCNLTSIRRGRRAKLRPSVEVGGGGEGGSRKMGMA